MDKPKAKNSPSNLRFYWYFFIPLTIVLSLMVYFPLRIALDELLLDIIFYSAILLFCIASTVHIYYRFHERSRRLVVILLLCTLLSGLQVFDLAVLRTGRWTGWMGEMYYELRTNSYPDCHMFSERTIGNDTIAIAYDIDRFASWPACGG